MDPVGRELNAEEQAILTVLMQEGRASHGRTAEGVATALERGPVDVAGVLARLERDGLVSRGTDPDGEEGWTATVGGAATD